MNAPATPLLIDVRETLAHILGAELDPNLSVADGFAKLSNKQRRQVLRKMGPDACSYLRGSWDFWGRPSQRWNPTGPSIQAWFAGRGAGKTRSGAERCHEKADDPESCGGEILLAAPTATDYRDTMVEGPSGILSTQKPWNPVFYEPSKMMLTWKGSGVVGHLRSSEKPRAFRGLNTGFAWLDEVAFWSRVQECWDNIMFALRHGNPSECMITTTPIGSEFIKALNEDKSVQIHTGSTYDNKGHLDPAFIQRLKDQYEGTSLGDQEIHGVVQTDSAHQVFKADWFRRVEPHAQPDYIRTVVAVDPGGGNETLTVATAGELPPETGIAAVSIDRNGCLYLRGDASTSDTNFGPAVVRLANQVNSKLIIAESNYGGGMVKTAIEGTPEFNAQRGIRFELVRSIAGKIARAIPVAMRAEQGRVFHVGGSATYRDMETQLTSLDRRVSKPKKSPDRADAYVHACLHLMQWFDERHASGNIKPISADLYASLVRGLNKR